MATWKTNTQSVGKRRRVLKLSKKQLEDRRVWKDQERKKIRGLNQKDLLKRIALELFEFRADFHYRHMGGSS